MAIHCMAGWRTAVLSNLISNVPVVLVLKLFVQSLADQQHAWLVVASHFSESGSRQFVS
jgi:Na+/H+ antiporter NhaD/arsenite permease-like protein